MNNMEHINQSVQNILRVVELLEEVKGALTPTEISKRLNLNYNSLKSYIYCLEKLQKISIRTNGRLKLIEIKNGSKR